MAQSPVDHKVVGMGRRALLHRKITAADESRSAVADMYSDNGQMYCGSAYKNSGCT
jgi:hypothetical protein